MTHGDRQRMMPDPEPEPPLTPAERMRRYRDRRRRRVRYLGIELRENGDRYADPPGIPSGRNA